MHMEVFSHQVPGGMLSNLVSQLDMQKAGDRLPDVLEEIPKVRCRSGLPAARDAAVADRRYPGGLNVLTGKRWGSSPGDEGLHPGAVRQGARSDGPEIVAKVLGNEERRRDDVRPGSLVTRRTLREVEAEIGDLARSEEDVLMYALFPNEARST
jgi:oxaloacetate decarboxylase (Na+ extruding) subunit alpha